MMRVLWEEWRGGNRFSSVRVVPLLLFGTLAALLITEFQPGSVFLVLVLAGLAGGVLSGTQRWNQVLARDWVGLEGTGPLVYGVGKVAGWLLLLAAWTACLLPPLVLVTLVWGVPPGVIGAGLAWTLAAAIGAQAIGHAVTWGTGEFQRILGSILVFLWIAASLQVPEAQAFNPLWQVWNLFHDPGRPFDAPAFASILGGAAGLWALVIVILGKTEARR
jgi:hypothetical protein